MDQAKTVPTKILIIDRDDAAFAICQCMARTLTELPPLELIHAHDATEALSLLESVAPDVVVVDDAEPMERDLLLDCLAHSHPPVVLCTSQTQETVHSRAEVTYLPKNETLEGFHQTLKIAAAIGMRHTETRGAKSLH